MHPVATARLQRDLLGDRRLGVDLVADGARPVGEVARHDVGGQAAVRLGIAGGRHVRLQLGALVVAGERHERPEEHELVVALAGGVLEQRVVRDETAGRRLRRQLARRLLVVAGQRGRRLDGASSPRGSTLGAWATDHAPSRSKKSAGCSWYFE